LCTEEYAKALYLWHEDYRVDLFTPIVTKDKFHPNFAKILARGDEYNQEVMNQWAEGFVDRDGKFVHEFQTSFNSSFWELYVFAVLKELRYTVDFNHNAPDFVVTKPVEFCVEATVASNAKDALPEFHPLGISSIPKDLNEFNRVAILRLLNSISGKSSKYLDSYQKFAHVTAKPFVLALAPFDQPFAYLQINRAIEAALYGYYLDEEAFLATANNVTKLTAHEVLSVRKGSDKTIPTGVFNNTNLSHISAVIFNSCATWGKVRALSNDPDTRIHFTTIRFDPRTGQIFKYQAFKHDYQEALLDGLRIYHNPHATYPLEWDTFDAPGVFQAIPVNRETNEWLWSMDQPPLVFRKVTLPLNPKSQSDNS
jgi:hypothetical protein